MGGVVSIFYMLVLTSQVPEPSGIEPTLVPSAVPQESSLPSASEQEIEELQRIDEGRKLLEQGLAEEAHSKLSQAFASSWGKNISTLAVRAWALFETGRYEELLKILPDDQNDNEIVFLKGSALMGLGKQEEGIVLLRQLWWREPTQVWGVWALWQLGKANLVSRYLKGERS